MNLKKGAAYPAESAANPERWKPWEFGESLSDLPQSGYRTQPRVQPEESVGFTAKRVQNLAQGGGFAEPWVPATKSAQL
jgi:hypothetical protein